MGPEHYAHTVYSENFGVSTLRFINLGKLWLDGTYLQDPNYNQIPFETKIGAVLVVGQNFTEKLSI